ncbi:MAG: DHH family phosphoesterase [Oscillospiraceae bacterium]|nr:DHH family phosphoesterase [Oscillospiraceae bacterium]
MNKKLGRLLRPSFGMFIALLALFACAAIYVEEYLLAGIEFFIVVAVLVIYIIHRSRRRREIQRYLHKSLENVTSVDGSHPPFPMVALRLGDQTIVYANDAFAGLTGFRDLLREKKIGDILPGFNSDWLAEGKTQYPYDVTLHQRRYRIYGTTVYADDPKQTRLGVLYLSDLTELYQVRDEYIRSRPVTSLILVDNYDELTKNLSEGAISAMHAKINDAITEWTSQYGGLLRRLEKNRFLLIFEKRDLKHIVDNKFNLLEQMHEIVSPNGLPVSLSIGVGVDCESYEEGYEFAALAIEMALSRGGDQAVIKDRMNFTFYGGRNKEADNRSKVRSRITANSLMELIGQSSRVFIMGHKNADLDAVGAAVGVCCLCRKKGKDAHIVLDMEENAATKLIDQLIATPEYKNVFISGQEALIHADNRSLLVVVDTNRPDQVENRHLLEAITSVCVIDHHRRAADYITPVVVNLHETYASSASELVTELLEYAVEKKDVLPIEAKSLMAGIFLDTKNFNVRTGERTFEAAAYLRQLGADTVEVKKLLQNDFQDTMAKYQIIKSARLYRQEIAIAALNASTSRALAAQAADELLNISGISASFVLYPDEDRVMISARSIGEANVQMILEPLGGGGNTATAGAQLKDTTVKDALDELVRSIDQYYDA